MQVLRILAVPDTRPGRAGQVTLGILFQVDGQGPFGFELPAGPMNPIAVVRRMAAVAREVRSVLLL